MPNSDGTVKHLNKDGHPKRFAPCRQACKLAMPVLATLLLMAAFILSGLLTGCRGAAFESTIVVSGSTTLLPIAEVAAQEFQEAHPEYNVLVSGMGTSAGIEAVGLSGTADVGMASRDLRGDELEMDLLEIPVAYDGIAVIVHPSNPVSDLTVEQVRDIFAGNITNWSEVGGEDLPVVIVNRDEASGTRSAFASAVMEDELFEVNSVVLPGTGQVREVVARTPEAIGYISVGFVEPRHVNTIVKALSLNGVEATDENIIDGTYPVSRALHFLTSGVPTGTPLEYIEFVLSEQVQLGAVIDAGFLPVTEQDLAEFRHALGEDN
ncbi:MAG: phosphate ABC transporter substrate-binding protein [Coriobacteriia bacterium]|nr:phosphate ABC transporter substrate-binding protein [Coriobacteriia bacterium]